jgi:hypothetical protein
LDKSSDLHSNIIEFDFGFKDSNRLGDIRDTVKEQGVLSELSQLIDNDINREHKTEAGQQELVKLIHHNLTPNNPVMLAMNRVQPPAKTLKDFYVKFLRVRAENRAAWHVANDLGFIKPSTHSSFSNQNNNFSDPSSKQKRQKRGDEFREKNNSSKPFNAETCWTCGIKGHSRP